MQKITIEIHGPHSEASLTREKRFAYGERGGRISMMVSRERDGHLVLWNVDRGLGWQAKNWRKSKLSADDARAFVEEKWAVLTEWLKNMEPKSRGNGAAAAFSAQVATMGR